MRRVVEYPSLPYNRTAETDFGERKSEYNKRRQSANGLPAFLKNQYY